MPLLRPKTLLHGAAAVDSRPRPHADMVHTGSDSIHQMQEEAVKKQPPLPLSRALLPVRLLVHRMARHFDWPSGNWAAAVVLRFRRHPLLACWAAIGGSHRYPTEAQVPDPERLWVSPRRPPTARRRQGVLGAAVGTRCVATRFAAQVVWAPDTQPWLWLAGANFVPGTHASSHAISWICRWLEVRRPSGSDCAEWTLQLINEANTGCSARLKMVLGWRQQNVERVAGLKDLNCGVDRT